MSDQIGRGYQIIGTEKPIMTNLRTLRLLLPALNPQLRCFIPMVDMNTVRRLEVDSEQGASTFIMSHNPRFSRSLQCAATVRWPIPQIISALEAWKNLEQVILQVAQHGPTFADACQLLLRTISSHPNPRDLSLDISRWSTFPAMKLVSTFADRPPSPQLRMQAL